MVMATGGTEDTPDDAPPTDAQMENLRHRSVRGGVVTLSAQGAKFGLNLGSTVVLARLLKPEDFGLVAMIAAVVGFVMMLKDAGLSMATVQRARITQAQVSNLFWVNVVIGVVAAVVVAALAPALAAFFHEPRLVAVTLVTAISFVFGGIAVQHQALLRRRMRFTTLAWVDVVSAACGVVVALTMALMGAGYWSLVGMVVATAAAQSVMLWVSSGWRPGRPTRGSGVRPLLRFGGNLTALSLISYVARNLDNILIGWFWGATPLGLYSRAYGLLMLPIRHINAPVAGVMIPALSRLQHAPSEYERFYTRSLNALCYATLPLVGFTIVFANEIVRVVLGPQWDEAADVFRLLAVGAGVQPILNTAGWVYVSLDQTGRMLRAGIVASTLFVLAFIIALPWGIHGVAIAWSAVVFVSGPFLLWYAYARSPVRMLGVVMRLTGPVVLAVSGAIVALVGRMFYAQTSPVLTLAIGCVSWLIGAALAGILLPSIRADLRGLFHRVLNARRAGPMDDELDSTRLVGSQA